MLHLSTLLFPSTPPVVWPFLAFTHVGLWGMVRQVGELGMVLHMCRLKSNDAMWNFQRAFVDALKQKFPEFHSKPANADAEVGGAPSTPRGKPSGEDPSDDESDDVPEKERSRSVLLSPSGEIQPTSKMPRAHRVFVKTQDQVMERDGQMAKRYQREEEAALHTHAHALDADAQFAKELQEAEDAKIARKQSLSFDDVDPLSVMPT